MKAQEISKVQDARLVTVGVLKAALKEERGITLQELLKLEGKIVNSNSSNLEEFRRLEQKMDKKFSEMDEKFITNQRFDRNMTAIAGSFNQVHEAIHQIQMSIDHLTTIMGQEFSVLRAENKEFLQQREQFYATDIRHERKLDELDIRVLKLEIA